MRPNDPFADEIASNIKNDLSSGATELVRKALTSLFTYADVLRTQPAHEAKTHLHLLSQRLKNLHPSMAPLHNILTDWQSRLDELAIQDPKHFIEDVQTLCTQKINSMNTGQDKLVTQAVSSLGNFHTIMTLSRSSTLCAVFTKLPQRPLGFIVCESRPGCEGKILATTLASSEVSVEYIVDAAIGNHIQQADAVVVGADTILADGSVVNKCGTSLLALAAQYYKLPFYVIADSSKCAGFFANDRIREDMPATELAAPDSPWIYPHNFYFDVTDAALVDGYITEFGMERNWPWSRRAKP
ncbi:MAG: ribose 1,5-bisphosphate isomerase [Paraglaciecola sp.]|jgi:ribose 1,5-bisphosphate isomerase